MKPILIFLAASMAFPQDVQFADVTKSAGISFTHNSGRAGKRWLPETMGSGCAFIDADGDGWPDIVLINSKDWTPRGRRSIQALYRNNRNGTFTNVTAGSGLDIELYGIGVAFADYDNDGRDDLYITALEGDRLFHNEGNFKFRDVTAASGIANKGFPASAAFLDYDKDGRADLFVANYVQWTAKGDIHCSLDGSAKSYCTPESYKGMANKLYHNLGNGKFEDVTAKAGLSDPTGKSLGIAVIDYNSDGRADLFVANDTQPNKLYRNNGNGTFTDVATQAGVAFSEDGVARGAMGVDAIDYDGSGRPHLLVGNFSNQMLGLYHNEGNGLFVDEAPRSAIGRASLLSLAFGVFFFDYDLDGRPDIFFTTVSYPIKNTGYFEKVSKRLVLNGSWATSTDRDIRVAGRHSRRYYQFADQWLRNEVAAARLSEVDAERAEQHRLAAAEARASLVAVADEVEVMV